MTRCQLKSNRFAASVLTVSLILVTGKSVVKKSYLQTINGTILSSTLDQKKKMKHLPNLSDATKKKVEKIIKEIKSGQEEEVYYIAIESIRGAQSADKWIFKVVGHMYV